jgi:hypothetical protein
MVLYRLRELEPLTRAVENQDDVNRGQRFSVRRWSSRLALARAQKLVELMLETEPEWRLYEDLHARCIDFKIEAGRPRASEPEDVVGRARFTGADWTVRYAGPSGFELLEDNAVEPRYFARPADIADLLALRTDLARA